MHNTQCDCHTSQVSDYHLSSTIHDLKLLKTTHTARNIFLEQYTVMSKIDMTKHMIHYDAINKDSYSFHCIIQSL